MAKNRFSWRSQIKAPARKLSSVLLEYSGGYFEVAKDPDSKQSMLNTACNAWNIANLQEADREAEIQACLSEYANANPGIDDVNNVEYDLRKLIERKLLLFSTDTRHIVGAQISSSGGKDVLHVVSMKKDG